MIKTIMLSAACAIAATAVAGAAMAQGESDAARSIYREQVSVPVSYADLDLSSASGATTMLHRLNDAALNACGADDSSVSEYKWAVRESSCYHASMDRAVAALDAPAVTQLWQAHAVPAAG